ncbi:opine metallophore biosynthesis dehydrogenase [Halalkalibacter sp. AB-rgal2]|uniref:opine metallophore biosynthesis dehydrogenase n=1 Tax=Halalkalibacter sp. AB-rgal2 TaxID=3242695 RepID=UPI00359E91C4
MKRVLLLGTGPTSVQLAVILKKYAHCDEVGIVGRTSVRSEGFFSALERNENRLQAHIQNQKDESMQGECSIDQVFCGYETIKGTWDTLILSVTTDAYMDVLQQIDTGIIRDVTCIILISPTFGSNFLVKSFFHRLHLNVEVISFSTYVGDTRWLTNNPSNQVLTTALKKKVFIGSTSNSSETIDRLDRLCQQLGITLEKMRSPIEAETRNISLYVHPPLFMNPFSLKAIFEESVVMKYVYKLFPEGPITQNLIRDLRTHWQEIMNILNKIGIEEINLLKFMIDDNYPVRPESISRHDIESFPQFQVIHQEYLLYIRYSALLIDPFSKPNKEGKYFDFSAVPIRQMFVNREGELDIPRMPKEDYYRIKIIQGIAKYLGLSSPTIDKFVETYEIKIKEVTKAHSQKRLSNAFVVQRFHDDVQMICEEIDQYAN